MKKPEKAPKIIIGDKFLKASIYFLKNLDEQEQLKKMESENYPYWEELKYSIKKWKINPELVWQYTKLLRHNNFETLKISKEPGFIFKLTIPNNIQKRLHEFDMHMGGIL